MPCMGMFGKPWTKYLLSIGGNKMLAYMIWLLWFKHMIGKLNMLIFLKILFNRGEV